MYAVIRTGGKQYRVVSGEKLKIEQIPAEVGAEITFDQVLMVGEGETVQVGTPTVGGATVRVTVEDKVRGLDAGADDYVVKPVDLDELAARLRALVRRAHGQPSEALVVDEVTLEPAGRSVLLRGQPVTMSVREFDVLHALMLNAGRVLSREQIEQHVYSWGQEVESNTVEVHIHHLRRKLGSAFIQTVRGVGYRVARERTPT